MNDPTKIMLIEDNPEYRRVIDLALKRDKSVVLTHSLGTAERALEVLSHMIALEKPEIILLDLHLPGMSGLEALPLLLEASEKTKIIGLTQSNKESDVLQAISSGASGYLLKSSGIKQIKEAIQLAAAGGAAIDAQIAQFLLQKLQEQKPQEGIELTTRELEILNLLAEGLVKKEIGQRLKISTFTVQAHVRHIYDKLRVPNAAAAVGVGFRAGLLPRKEEA